MKVDGERPARHSTLREVAGEWEDLGRAVLACGGPDSWRPPQGATRWVPPAELVETEDNLFLTVELPGVEAKDLDISLQDRTVVLKGQKRGLNRGGAAVRFSELDYGSFERKVQLPCAALAEGLMATLARGVLILTIPKQ